jgi:thioredoxin 1
MATDIVVITNNNFNRLVTIPDIVWVFDVGAPRWCKPCRDMEPIFLRLTQQYHSHSKIQFGTINADTEDTLCQTLNVDGLPTFIIMTNGIELERMVGKANFDTLAKMVERWV